MTETDEKRRTLAIMAAILMAGDMASTNRGKWPVAEVAVYVNEALDISMVVAAINATKLP